MAALHADEQAQRVWQSFWRSSLVWLILGGSSGLLLALQRLWPSLLQNQSWLRVGRLQLFYLNFLIFGWLFLLLMGLWFLRLRQIKGGEVQIPEIWRFGLFFWNYALFCGWLSSAFGYHTDLPILTWIPEVYILLLFALSLFVIGVVLNLPRASWFAGSPSMMMLLSGLIVLGLTLFCFLIAPAKIRLLAPAFVHVVLVVGLLLPTMGLVMPLTSFRPPRAVRQWQPTFFWGALMLVPLTAPLFSSIAEGVGVAVTMQLLWGLAVVGWLRCLWELWRTPRTFVTQLSLDPSGLGTAEDGEVAKAELARLKLVAAQDADRDATPPSSWIAEFEAEALQQAPWRVFLRAGSVALGLSVLLAFAYGMWRLLGYSPNPAWPRMHIELFLFGCLWFWLLGALYLIRPDLSLSVGVLRRQFGFVLLGVSLLVLGGLIESSFLDALQHAQFSRGQAFSLFARGLRLGGLVCLGLALTYFVRLVRQLDLLPQKS